MKPGLGGEIESRGNAEMTTVKTDSGDVAGRNEGGLCVFKGIPFAEPPVGALRFRPPVPCSTWEGALNATEFGASPPQLRAELAPRLSEFMAEDCLTVNVWTPGCDAVSRPVMVWIYGGSFLIGSSSRDVCDGANLAANGDVVVVSMNYRVGALGFLHLEEVGGSEFAGSCNVGLLDQIAALEWVQRNVAAFGGDPDNVTVFGVSAGGISISALLAIPAARGLFRKAITQSGAANQTRSVASAATASRQFREAAGADSVNALQALSLEEVLDAQKRVLAASSKPDAFFGPVVDGTLIPEPPMHAIAAGRAADVPLMTGTTLDEMRYWLVTDPAVANIDAERLERALSKMLGKSAQGLLGAYEQSLPDSSDAERRMSILGDLNFTIPAIRMLEGHLPHQSKVWMYLFTWASPAHDGKLGSPHAIEQPFVFGTFDSLFAEAFEVAGPACAELSDQVQEAWVSFARHGDPSHEGLPNWPAYDLESRNVMVFDTPCSCVADPHAGVRGEWDAVPFDGLRPPIGIRPGHVDDQA